MTQDELVEAVAHAIDPYCVDEGRCGGNCECRTEARAALRIAFTEAARLCEAEADLFQHLWKGRQTCRWLAQLMRDRIPVSE